VRFLRSQRWGGKDGRNVGVPAPGAAKLHAKRLWNVVNPLLDVMAKQHLTRHAKRRAEPIPDLHRRLSRTDS
jgi:hypothetical protein